MICILPSTKYADENRVVDVAPNVLLIITGKWWSVVNVSDHKIVATLRACNIYLGLQPSPLLLVLKGFTSCGLSECHQMH